MLNFRKAIGVLAAASALVVVPAQAEIEYELHAGYSSLYLFRGLDLGDNLVEAGADLATEFNGIGFSAGAWYGSYDAPLAGGQVDSDEIDLYAEFSKDFGVLIGSVGYIAYLYPQADGTKALLNQDDVHEVSFGISRDFGFVNVAYNYYLAVEGDNFGYMELDFSRSFELNQCLTLNLDTNVGYLGDEDMFSAWSSRVSLDWGFAGQAKLSPFVAVAVGLSDSDATGPYGATGNELLGGAMLSVGF